VKRDRPHHTRQKHGHRKTRNAYANRRSAVKRETVHTTHDKNKPQTDKEFIREGQPDPLDHLDIRE